jgi:beta-1,3-galactosyltransferase / beta-1,3-N-acetylglucosaminyltransferase
LPYVYQLRHGHTPEIPPINIYNYTFITDCQQKCMDDGNVEFPRLVFIVKSAMENFNRRNAIRNSWGFEKRFSDVIVRTIFTLGLKTF